MYALNVHAAPGCAYGNECMMLTRVGSLEGMEGGERGKGGRGALDDMWGIFGR